jgi:pyrroloquinoline quinone biosynthesis protein B
MRVRLLGTAAGGGFPQWNCACACCAAARERPDEVKPRTQSSVAVSGDGSHWFLLNASPDVRFQIESFPPLQPPKARSTGIAGVLLTNADLDHTIGLLLLREGDRVPVHATPTVRSALQAGFGLPGLLERYGGAEWREPSRVQSPLLSADGAPTGLSYAAFPVLGKPPRYLEGRVAPHEDDNVGYRLVDLATGRALVFVPDCAGFDATLADALADCDTLLFDGTFFNEDEMLPFGGRSATAMAHVPIGGAEGSLARLAELPVRRKIYLHLNNTNPVLLPDSQARAAVVAAGIEVSVDGMELTL